MAEFCFFLLRLLISPPEVGGDFLLEILGDLSDSLLRSST